MEQEKQGLDPHERLKRMLILAGIAVIIGIIVTVVVFKVRSTHCTVAAVATVTGYDAPEEYVPAHRMYETVYYLQVSYDVDGKTVNAQYPDGDSEMTYQVGDTINIKYNPQDPTEFMIVDPAE